MQPKVRGTTTKENKGFIQQLTNVFTISHCLRERERELKKYPKSLYLFCSIFTMANPPRNRKRVRALRRAPDGSAFQKCGECGSSVPVALMDMHDCQRKRDVKKDVKRILGKPPAVKKMSRDDEPRSAFQFFLECYTKTRIGKDMIEINREAFDEWKKMPHRERWPYIDKAEKLEREYMKVIREEVNQMSQEGDDEADSAMVGKFAQHYEEYDDFENSDDYSSYWYECEDISAWKRRLW